MNKVNPKTLLSAFSTGLNLLCMRILTVNSDAVLALLQGSFSTIVKSGNETKKKDVIIRLTRARQRKDKEQRLG